MQVTILPWQKRCAIKTALDWKTYYAAERHRLGPEGLCACLDRAEALAPELLAGNGALVFPHTRLEDSGELPAAAALAVLRAGCDEVLALGVLHGGRQQDAALVARARQGDAQARDVLRRVHGPGLPGDGGHWQDEFSLDNFSALLELAARRLDKKPPRVISVYPFLVGQTPTDLPGLSELRKVLARGAVLIATTDPIHHGAGYGTPAAEFLPLAGAAAAEYARLTIEKSFGLLTSRDYAGFERDAAAVRSDFRDVGPVMTELLAPSPLRSAIHRVALVDYSQALAAPSPTWVAAALATFSAADR